MGKQLGWADVIVEPYSGGWRVIHSHRTNLFQEKVTAMDYAKKQATCYLCKIKVVSLDGRRVNEILDHDIESLAKSFKTASDSIVKMMHVLKENSLMRLRDER